MSRTAGVLPDRSSELELDSYAEAFIDVSYLYRGKELPNAMTVDVEDYFQVSAFENHISREDWHLIESRVPRNIDRILQLFSDQGIKATFFTLGCVCEQLPEVIRRIADEGHEVASHGFGHERVWNKSPLEFRQDVLRAKSILEDTTGKRVSGYRAPSFSIGNGSMWAFDVLLETGHLYSSSIFPIRHDHYGLPSARRFPYRVGANGILEVPPTTLNRFGRNWPCAGGGYFRLLPMAYSLGAMRSVNTREEMPAVFYFHPWEIDPDQPRIAGIPLKAKFRHYVNLSRMESRLTRLARAFSWGRMDEIYLSQAT